MRVKASYSKAKIFKLSVGNLHYVGSTTSPLNVKKASMKQNYSRYVHLKRGHFLPFFHLFSNENEKPTIKLVEAYPCDTKEQLNDRVSYWQDELNKSLMADLKKTVKKMKKNDA